MRKKHKIKYKKKHKLLLAAGLLAASTLITACNAQTTETESSSKKIVVGVDKFKPYSYQDMNGNYAGIDIELATEAFEKLGYEPEFKTIDWEDKNDYLEDGTIDCIWSCYSMTDREDKYQWAGPYMYSRQVVAVRKESDIYDLSDLSGCRIGVQATTKAEDLFLHILDSDLPADVQVNSFSTTEELFALLRKGYVDAIAGHEALIGELVNDSTDAYRVLDESPYISQIGVAFQKDTHKDLAEDLTKVLKDMENDGTTGNIVQKYGLNPQNVLLGGSADE